MQLEFRDDDNGPRHYLDGKPVHCGTVLEAKCMLCEQWHSFRYESSGPISDHNAYLVGQDDRCLAISQMCAFRWPQSESRSVEL